MSWQIHACYFDEPIHFCFVAANLHPYLVNMSLESLISQNFCNFHSRTMPRYECTTNKLFGCKRISATFATSNSVGLMRIGNSFLCFHCLSYLSLLLFTLLVFGYINIICIALAKPLEVKSSIHVFVCVVLFVVAAF